MASTRQRSSRRQLPEPRAGRSDGSQSVWPHSSRRPGTVADVERQATQQARRRPARRASMWARRLAALLQPGCLAASEPGQVGTGQTRRPPEAPSRWSTPFQHHQKRKVTPRAFRGRSPPSGVPGEGAMAATYQRASRSRPAKRRSRWPRVGLRVAVKTRERRGSSFSQLGLEPNHTGLTAQSLFFLEGSCRVKRSDTQTFSNFSNYFKRVLKLQKRSSSFSK